MLVAGQRAQSCTYRWRIANQLAHQAEIRQFPHAPHQKSQVAAARDVCGSAQEASEARVGNSVFGYIQRVDRESCIAPNVSGICPELTKARWHSDEVADA